MGIINKKGRDTDYFNQLKQGISYKNPEHLNQCKVALQAFLNEPRKEVKSKVK
jgi:hypothetical protein